MKGSNPLANFFKRVAYRSSRIKAITATARKLSVVVYKMLTTGGAYTAEKLERNMAKIKSDQIRRIKKSLHKFDISWQDLGWSIDVWQA